MYAFLRETGITSQLVPYRLEEVMQMSTQKGNGFKKLEFKCVSESKYKRVNSKNQRYNK